MGSVISAVSQPVIGGKDMTPTSWYQTIVPNFVQPIGGSVMEIGRLFPDSIIFGSLLLYFLTQNMAYGIFTVFLMETSLIHKLISFVFDKTSGGKNASNTSGPSRTTDMKCRSGFRYSRIEFERAFLGGGYPSVPMFFFGSIASYLLMADLSFKETLDSMGLDWQGRFTFAMIMIAFVSVAAIMSRIGCESLGELGIAFAVGIAVGVAMYYLNSRVFGMESMNFLGLPYLIDKSKTDNPLYTCTSVPQGSEESP
jgi:hypothetical protein